MELKFDEKGLIPAIVQDFYSKQVLMFAYMNKESLDISIREGKTCFYSRSRNKLWRKGEESGNTQSIASIMTDCDSDAIVVEVVKKGPACHTGAESCFFKSVLEGAAPPGNPDFSLKDLFGIINGRKKNPKEGSYTSYLFSEGIEKILKKVGEESAEVLIAGAKKNKEEAVYEIADLTYHLLVMMSEMGISIEDITKELASRHIIQENP